MSVIERLERSEAAGGRQRLLRRESPLCGGLRTVSIQVVPATMDHARAIVLREADAREIAALGMTKEEGLGVSLARAVWADAYLVDNEVAAIVGFSLSSLLGGVGQPWLVTGEPVNRIKKSFAAECRRRITGIRARHGALMNMVHAEYTESLRFMAWLGFAIGAPQPFGRLGQPFCLVSMGAP